MRKSSEWPQMIEDLSRVQKLVHLAYRMDAVDQSEYRGTFLRVLRDAYEHEITLQARRVGCPGLQGRVSGGQVLNELNQRAEQTAAGIAATFNRDLVYAIKTIRSEVPTANRHVYANRLGTWEQRRAKWKTPQIAQALEGEARSLAQQHFYRWNNITGTAILTPKTAVCPVCQGWINRGEIPMPVALNNPPPYHPGCPHIFSMNPNRVPKEECPTLWMGT